MMNDKERLFDEEGKGFVITHNLYRNSVGEWVEQYKENEIHRINKRKNAVYLTHEILSWHKDDTAKISLGAMEDMAREYIELRNPNGLYIGIPHTDKEHYHVHFAVSALEFHNGKTMRLSKKEFALLKKRIQQYQQDKYPELSKSVVQHGSGKKKFQTANGR
ncbi:MAG: relaxase/mobilization nuclease domain-containing protein [Bacteroidetes bacterium]|nr:relaxase/mobilization nuclease domain-containing protein [Bacteroidota bacterium]